MNDLSAINTGIAFCGILSIVYTLLKLTHVIQWPWLWVLAPIWIPFAVITVLLLIALVAFISRSL